MLLLCLPSKRRLLQLADCDTLDDPEAGEYVLEEGGQAGLRIAQAAPLLRFAYGEILSRTKKHFPCWVGDDAIHLADPLVANGIVAVLKWADLRHMLRILHAVSSGPGEGHAPAAEALALCGFKDRGDLRRALVWEVVTRGFNGSGAPRDGCGCSSSGSCMDGRFASLSKWFNEQDSHPGGRFAHAFRLARHQMLAAPDHR